jgi:geranylgeranyl diphosphate synthase type 3
LCINGFLKKFPDLQKHKMSVLTETGALFYLGIQLLQLFSENKSDFTKLTGIFGLYYQMSNDYRNLFGKEVTPALFNQSINQSIFIFHIISYRHQ